ncbi:MAG: ArsR family transcriptional regulator [Nitrospiraceae bacterium]|nr:ArsR family transcriptional regulator [Nitrospiraceae bacterium]
MDSLLEKIEILKAIVHPVRIGILEELMKGAKCVTDFEGFPDVNQPNFSQYLSVLRDHGVVD